MSFALPRAWSRRHCQPDELLLSQLLTEQGDVGGCLLDHLCCTLKPVPQPGQLICVLRMLCAERVELLLLILEAGYQVSNRQRWSHGSVLRALIGGQWLV